MSAKYLNTDLILRSQGDLSGLNKALDKSPTMLIFHGMTENALRLSVFETSSIHTEPKEAITKLLKSVSRLPKRLKPDWDACERRTLDIGFECEGTQFCSEHVIPHALVAQAAEFGIEFQITIYREERPEDVKSYPEQDNAD